MEKIILASGSPRRKELLEQAGMEFEVLASHAEEVITKTEPGEIVEELSLCKAQAAAEMLDKKERVGKIILGADTVVVLDGEILGKPGSENRAIEMLRSLQGKTHQVYTGVTLMQDGRTYSFHEKTDVEVYPMTEEEIAAYAATGDPLDKAGAYGIQGEFAKYIKGIHGDYYNVVGLPIGRVYQEIKEL